MTAPNREHKAESKADELAYARVIAKRGYPAERGWSPDLVAEYEAETTRGIDERLARLARVATKDEALLTALRETLQYAEAVLGEPGAAKAARS